jgi:hypothetical protein
MNKKISKVCLANLPSTVKLVSYTMKSTIPTGNYENIQPEITVTASNLIEAHKYCMDFIVSLHRQFSINAERGPVIATPPTPENIKTTVPQNNSTATESSPSFNKAKQAIDSCLTPEALNLIAEQVNKSVKLNDQEKGLLLELATAKTAEFNGTGA